MERITNNEQETIHWGKTFAKKLLPGTIVCLYGDLGSGKTTLVKGIAKGLGVVMDVVSPTFTLMNLYETSNPSIQLCHIDMYRLEDERDLRTIGALDYIGMPNGITMIEWPEKIEKLLPKKKIQIHLTTLDASRRKIVVTK